MILELLHAAARGEFPPEDGVTEVVGAAAGAQAAVLGCTEIGMLISQADTDVPLVDTTVVHAEKAAEMALA